MWASERIIIVIRDRMSLSALVEINKQQELTALKDIAFETLIFIRFV